MMPVITDVRQETNVSHLFNSSEATGTQSERTTSFSVINYSTIEFNSYSTVQQLQNRGMQLHSTKLTCPTQNDHRIDAHYRAKYVPSDLSDHARELVKLFVNCRHRQWLKRCQE